MGTRLSKTKTKTYPITQERKLRELRDTRIKPIVHQIYLTPSVRVVDSRKVFTMALSDGPDMRRSRVRVIGIRGGFGKLSKGHQTMRKHPKVIVVFYLDRFGAV